MVTVYAEFTDGTIAAEETTDGFGVVDSFWAADGIAAVWVDATSGNQD